MPSDKQIARDAINNAFIELRLGKKQAARTLAQHAIQLAPELEDPWLVLAAIAEPRASLEYLKEALRINPGSYRARHGLLEVQRRLEKISRAASPPATRKVSIEARQRPVNTNNVTNLPAARRETVEARLEHEETSQGAIPQSSPPIPMIKNRPSRLSWFGWLTLFGLVFIAIVAQTMLSFKIGVVKARGLPTSNQKTIVLQPMASSTPTVTETPGPTEPPTITPVPTETPLPAPTESQLPTEPPSPTPLSAPTLAVAAVQYDSQVQPAPADATGGKRIIVYLSQQHLYAYQGNELVYSFVVSTGANNATRIGTFSILDKIPNAWSDPWRFWMPDWLGLYWVGYTENGIHALPVLPNGNVLWGDGLGTPISHGCVVLSTQDAQLLFNWAEVGTQVQILR